MGNFVADASLHYITRHGNPGPGEWTESSIVLIPVGGLRTTVPKGGECFLPTHCWIHLLNIPPAVITFGDLVTALPFDNSMDLLDLRGDHLRETFEYGVSRSWNPDVFSAAYMIHVAGDF